MLFLTTFTDLEDSIQTQCNTFQSTSLASLCFPTWLLHKLLRAILQQPDSGELWEFWVCVVIKFKTLRNALFFGNCHLHPSVECTVHIMTWDSVIHYDAMNLLSPQSNKFNLHQFSQTTCNNEHTSNLRLLLKRTLVSCDTVACMLIDLSTLSDVDGSHFLLNPSTYHCITYHGTYT